MKALLSRIGAAVSIVTIVGLLLAASPDSLQIIEFPPYSGTLGTNNSILVSGPSARDGRGAYRATLSELSGVIGGGGNAPTGTVVSAGTPVDGALMVYDGTSGTNAKPARITTGSSTNLTVPGTVTGDVIQATKGFRSYQGSLTHAGTVTLDFDGSSTVNALSVTGNVTLATSNLATNRTYRLKLTGCSTNSSITAPSWKWQGYAPTTSTASKQSMVFLEAWGSNDTNVLAWFTEQP